MTTKLISQKYNHGNALNNKVTATGDEALTTLLKVYFSYRKALDVLLEKPELDFDAIVNVLNEYRNISIPILEKRSNSGQEGLRSTILEEFMYIIFNRVTEDIFNEVPENLFLGKAKSYVDLTFTPHSFPQLFQDPIPYIHMKDQDFVIGATFDLTISTNGKESKQKILVPVLAIECKTYIEKNMLDSCAGTARRLKSAMPYCMYMVVAEYMKMESATPELTDIDEVYVLCKATVGQRHRGIEGIHKIDAELIKDLVDEVSEHVKRTWWDPQNALSIGKIINRPQ